MRNIVKFIQDKRLYVIDERLNNIYLSMKQQRLVNVIGYPIGVFNIRTSDLTRLNLKHL